MGNGQMESGNENGNAGTRVLGHSSRLKDS